MKNKRGKNSGVPRLTLLALTIFVSYSLVNQAFSTAASSHPSSFSLGNSTTWVSGELSDLTGVDDSFMSFRSYYRLAEMLIPVNRVCDVDSHGSFGLHTNFSAQQQGPDRVSDIMVEAEAGLGLSNLALIDAESFEFGWLPPGWSATGNWSRVGSYSYHGNYAASYLGSAVPSSGALNTPNLNCSDAEAIVIDFWYRYDNLDASQFLLECYNGSSWTLIGNLSIAGQEERWLHYQEEIVDPQYFVANFNVRWSSSDVSAGESMFVDYVTVSKSVEMPNHMLDLEVQWTGVDYEEINEELAVYYIESNNTHSLESNGGYMRVGDGSPDWGSTSGTISFWVKWDTVGGRPWGQHVDMEMRCSGASLVLDWGGSNSLTSTGGFTDGLWYFIAVTWNEGTDRLSLYVGTQDSPPMLNAVNTVWTSTVSILWASENSFLASRGFEPMDGAGDDLRYWNTDRAAEEIRGDYNLELNGAEANLRSYFTLNNRFSDAGPDNNDGSTVGNVAFSSNVAFDPAPTEEIGVDVWAGGTWQPLLTSLTHGWNNISVSSYLSTSNLIIRYIGRLETNDAIRDQWKIDAAFLHLWSNGNVLDVEFTGSSEADTWVQLNWTLTSAWTTGSVNVTLQLFNYTSNTYPACGAGYIGYASTETGNTTEIQRQTVNLNPTDFRSTAANWRVRIRGSKNTNTTFVLRLDQLTLDYEYTAQPQDWSLIPVYSLPVIVGLLSLLIFVKRRKNMLKKTEEPDEPGEPREKTFSQLFGVTRTQLTGKKVLFEIDPTTNYQEALTTLVSEEISSGEKVYIFTNANSPLYTKFSKSEGVKFFLLTGQASSVQKRNEREILLPANNLSVMLDTIIKIKETHSRKSLGNGMIIYENLSDIILMSGFTETYKFLRWFFEIASPLEVSAFFVLNPTAHDTTTISSIRGLFQTRLAYTKIGPKIGSL